MLATHCFKRAALVKICLMQTRITRIEAIIPTLATREDLACLEGRMRSAIQLGYRFNDPVLSQTYKKRVRQI